MNLMVLSSPRGALWIQRLPSDPTDMIRGIRRDPDGSWRVVELAWGKKCHARFLPYDGRTGFLLLDLGQSTLGVVRVAAEGALEEPWFLQEVIEGSVQVDPDGLLRTNQGMGIRALDPYPTGWIREAIPGLAGSWLTRDGVQLIPGPQPGEIRAVRWLPPERALQLTLLWIREAILALDPEGRLVRIAHPGAEPEILAVPSGGIMRTWIFPDGRWVVLSEQGQLCWGDPSGLRGSVFLAESPDPENVPLLQSGVLPLHEGIWFPDERENGRSWWLHADGRLEPLPYPRDPHSRAEGWIRTARWWILPGERRTWEAKCPFYALPREGGELWELPALMDWRLYGDARRGEWGQDERRRIWFLPPDGSHPRVVPLPPIEGPDLWIELVGAVGGRAIVAVSFGPVGGRILAVRPDGAWEEWIPPASPLLRLTVREVGEGFVLHFPGWVGYLAPGRAAWAPGPETGSGDLEVLPMEEGWILRVGPERYLIDPEAPAIQRLGAL